MSVAKCSSEAMNLALGVTFRILSLLTSRCVYKTIREHSPDFDSKRTQVQASALDVSSHVPSAKPIVHLSISLLIYGRSSCFVSQFHEDLNILFAHNPNLSDTG